MASSSWIWITPPRFFEFESHGEFSHTENHKRKSSKSWMDVKGFLVLEFFGYFWSDTGSLRRVKFPAYLDLCASFFSWVDQWNLCLPQLVSVCKKNTLGASPPLEDCLGGVSSKGCISKAWGNCDAFLSRLMNLYDSMFVERNLLHEMVLSKWDDLLLPCCRFKGIQYGSLAGNIASTHQFN